MSQPEREPIPELSAESFVGDIVRLWGDRVGLVAHREAPAFGNNGIMFFVLVEGGRTGHQPDEELDFYVWT